MDESEIQKDQNGGSGTNFKFRTLDLKEIKTAEELEIYSNTYKFQRDHLLFLDSLETGGKCNECGSTASIQFKDEDYKVEFYDHFEDSECFAKTKEACEKFFDDNIDIKKWQRWNHEKSNRKKPEKQKPPRLQYDKPLVFDEYNDDPEEIIKKIVDDLMDNEHPDILPKMLLSQRTPSCQNCQNKTCIGFPSEYFILYKNEKI